MKTLFANLFVIMIGLFFCQNSYASDVYVSNSQGLNQAISTAKAGDVIKLSATSFGDISIVNKNYVTPIVFEGTNGTTIGKVNISNSSGITFKNISFERTKTGQDQSYTPVINIAGASNIIVNSSKISSSNDNNLENDISGVSIRLSKNITFSKNSFAHLYKGFVSFDNSNVILDENIFDKIMTVGAEFGKNSTFSKITNNSFKNFYPCNISASTCTKAGTNISVWNTGGTKVFSDIEINNNNSLLGEGNYSQFIILKSDNKNYKIDKVSIKNNTLYNNHINGIFVDGATNGVIEKNSLVQGNYSKYALNNSSTKPFLRIYNSTNISANKNLCFGIENISNTNISLNNNVISQRTDPSLNDNISKLLFFPDAGKFTVLTDLVPKQNSLLDLGNGEFVGASSYFYQEPKEIPAVTYNVFNKSDLENALKEANSGDKVILNSANYGDILLYGKNFTKPLNFIGTGEAIIEKLQITSSNNISFENIKFSHTKRETEFEWSNIVNLNLSNNISIKSSKFIGSQDNNFTNDVVGLGARSSKNLTISGNEFSNLEKGAVFDDIENVVYSGNTVFDIGVDGVAFGNNAVNIEISNNSMQNFKPCDIFDTVQCKKHPDFIQFWNNNGTKDNSNVVIKNNILKRGIGGVTQGIFIQANNSNFINKNFSIEGNILETSHIHGITIIDGQNISVKNNSVTTSATPVVTPISITEELKNPKIRFYRINSGEITGNTTNGVDLIDSVNIVQ